MLNRLSIALVKIISIYDRPIDDVIDERVEVDMSADQVYVAGTIEAITKGRL